MHSYFQFLTLQVFCPIILERDVKTTDFDPTLPYLGQNILSKDHYIFISVQYATFKRFKNNYLGGR